MTQPDLSIRAATPEDRQKVAALMHFEGHVHRHLDWRSPLDWLGYQPYLIAEQKGHLVGTLACPADPPGLGWIKLFAASSHLPVKRIWQELWGAVLEEAARTGSLERVSAIPLQSWFKNLLSDSGFIETHVVVTLSWMTRSSLPEALTLPAEIRLRPMVLDDLSAVQGVDELAFPLEWQNSQASLEVAFQQAEIASVAVVLDQVVGYQISTPSHIGVHLSRLAVHPAFQGKGIGSTLLWDVQSQCTRRGATIVTVNTQKNNTTSLSIYKRAGFQLTGEEYSVYQLTLLPSRAEGVKAGAAGGEMERGG